jgi:hypothetical protein
MNSSTSGGTSRRSWAAFFCRIAIRSRGRERDVGQEAPLEPGSQAVLQRGEVLGLDGRRDDDLLVRVVQRVEGMEELLLRALAVLQNWMSSIRRMSTSR